MGEGTKLPAMKLSQRAQAITPFLAMEFGKHAAALEAAGHRVIRLSRPCKIHF